MKKAIILIIPMAIGVLLSVNLFAQSPEKMSYQAVIRNAGNNLVTSQNIGMQISILQNSASGTAVYVETQTPVTNANGLVSIEIGSGTLVSGNFTNINWANGPYFIKTETDPTGGTSYTITGVSQLLSVPYALHSKTAENLTEPLTETDPIYTNSQAVNITVTDITNLGNLSGTNTGDQDGSETIVTAGTNVTVTGNGTNASPYVINSINSTGAGSYDFYLGQDTLNGIVFHIYLGQNGEQHGLIVSKTETTAIWGGSTWVGADRTEDGPYNMNLMPTGAGTARTWVETLGAGWYLPSIDELSLLWHNRYNVNKKARAINSALLATYASYWSSTEDYDTYAFTFHFTNGSTNNYSKSSSYNVRAVRAF